MKWRKGNCDKLDGILCTKLDYIYLSFEIKTKISFSRSTAWQKALGVQNVND